jgi:hypothetical protein
VCAPQNAALSPRVGRTREDSARHLSERPPCRSNVGRGAFSPCSCAEWRHGARRVSAGPARRDRGRSADASRRDGCARGRGVAAQACWRVVLEKAGRLKLTGSSEGTRRSALSSSWRGSRRPRTQNNELPWYLRVGSPQPRRRQMFRCGRLRRNTCPLRRRRRRPSQPSAASVTPQRMNERACRRCGAATWSSHRPYCVAHRPPPEARAKWAKKHPHGSRVRQRAPNPSRERRPPGRGGGGALPPLRSADRPGRAVGARPRAREAGLFRPSHFKCNRGL